MVRDSAKEKANREAQQKAWEEAGRNVNGKTTSLKVVLLIAHGPEKP